MTTDGYSWTAHWWELRAAALQRDGYSCTIAGCIAPATIVDHITTRPRQSEPTPLDRLDNLRSLCATHDAQMKENAGRPRAAARLKGCDVDGWPLARASEGFRHSAAPPAQPQPAFSRNAAKLHWGVTFAE
jgi:hypothetical protein